MTSQHLFAYGTLVAGILDPQLAAVLRRYSRMGPWASVAGRLFDLGEYPGALPSDTPNQRIRGRLIELLAPARCLPLLDRYEDVDPDDPARGLYRREQVEARTDGGASIRCWIYWLNHLPHGARPLPDGDWIGLRLPSDKDGVAPPLRRAP